MGLLLTTIAGLVLWIVLWSIGVKSFDAFMITIAMIVVAATAHVFAPFLPGKRHDDESGTRWNPR
jgi:O-antigen ligase